LGFCDAPLGRRHGNDISPKCSLAANFGVVVFDVADRRQGEVLQNLCGMACVRSFSGRPEKSGRIVKEKQTL
jgi:hypothetical protein